MKSPTAPILLTLVSALLGSCAHPDAGHYSSPRGDMLRISRSGMLDWSAPSKNNARFETVGMLGRPDSKGDRHLVTASTHPLLGTSLHFSPDGKTIDVTWRTFHKRPLPDRDTRYQKSEVDSRH